MTIQSMSKAIAGGIASIGAAWVAALWGFQVPPEAIELTTGLLTTALSAVIGFGLVYLSPPNRT